LLNDGSKHISILDWRTNTTLIKRVEMGRRHSRRSLLMSLPLAKTAPQKVSAVRPFLYNYDALLC
jgi:calcineurin-binding protein cabin-1